MSLNNWSGRSWHRLGSSRRSAVMLAILFVVQTVIAVPLIALLMPPFQAADEIAHAQRASQISLGGLIATRFDGDLSSGGTIDLGIDRLWFLFEGLRFHPDRKVSRAMMEQAAAIADGPLGKRSFANTAVYPPTLYGPVALAQRAGGLLNLSPLQTLRIARFANGAASITIAATAIALADGAAPLLYALLCLPMTLALFASVSQDGPMIALSALAVVLVGRGATHRLFRISGMLALTAVAMARPPYLPLCAIVLVLPGLDRVSRLLNTAIPVVAVLAWSILTDRVTLYRPSALQVAAQVRFLLHHPGSIPAIVGATLHAQLEPRCEACRQFIGVLGWLDTPLPETYYALTGTMLLLAAFLSYPLTDRLSAAARLGAAALIVASIGAIFFLQYLSWSPVGGRLVDGIQGRYFLPVAAFLAFVLPDLSSRLPQRLRYALLATVALYPALSILVTIRAIVMRYYL